MLSSQATKEYIFRQLDLLTKDSLVEVAQFIEYLQFRGQPTLKSASMVSDAYGCKRYRESLQILAAQPVFEVGKFEMQCPLVLC